MQTIVLKDGLVEMDVNVRKYPLGGLFLKKV